MCSTLIKPRYALHWKKSYFSDKHFESPTTFLSQVRETELKGVPCKRTATYRLAECQVSELKKRFKSDPFITGIEKELMAKNLGLTQAAVTNWFCRERKRKRNLLNKARNATTVVTAWQHSWKLFVLYVHFVKQTYLCISVILLQV